MILILVVSFLSLERSVDGLIVKTARHFIATPIPLHQLQDACIEAMKLVESFIRDHLYLSTHSRQKPVHRLHCNKSQPCAKSNPSFNLTL